MRKKIILLLAIITSVASMAQQIALTKMDGLKNDVFTCRIAGNVGGEGRFSGFAPFYVIYPDTHCDSNKALALIEELGVDKNIKEFSGGVAVVNPIGESYDNVADFEAYKSFINAMRVINNLKIIGIGNGATFVNQVVANNAYEVACILTINGKPGKASANATPVPAFVVGAKSDIVAKSYISINGAELVGKNSHNRIYANANEPLQRVVVSQANDQKLSEIFTDAWQNLLCKNYRFNNFKHTWYMGAEFGKYGAYELEPYVMFDDLKVKRNIVEKDLLGNGEKTLWYEYLPEKTLVAERGTVPLVVLLHGHNNDPRTQAETSGFIELAAKENFIVAEMEWQGSTEYCALGRDGVEAAVYEMIDKYPQINAERVYAEGLSAGSMTSTAIGITKSHLFAAVGGMSGGIFLREGTVYGADNRSLFAEATQKRGAVEVAYCSVTGTDDDVVNFVKPDNWKNNSILNAWNAYQIINDMEEIKELDFKQDAVFGVQLRDRHTEQTNKGISMEIGYLYKNEIPLIKIVAVNNYGHWNFKPAADEMWNFFKHFSRDKETKKLIYHP